MPSVGKIFHSPIDPTIDAPRADRYKWSFILTPMKGLKSMGFPRVISPRNKWSYFTLLFFPPGKHRWHVAPISLRLSWPQKLATATGSLRTHYVVTGFPNAHFEIGTYFPLNPSCFIGILMSWFLKQSLYN